MKISRVLCATLVISITVLSQNIAVANNHAFDNHNNRFEYGFYLKIPFAPTNTKTPDRAMKFGYAVDFKRTYNISNDFSMRHRDIKANLLNIEFTSTNTHKLSLAGQSIIGLDHRGLYLGPDGGASTEEIFIGLAIIAGLAAIIAFSGQEQTPAETQ